MYVNSHVAEMRMFNAPERRLVSTWMIIEVFSAVAVIVRTGPEGLWSQRGTQATFEDCLEFQPPHAENKDLQCSDHVPQLSSPYT